MNCFEFNKKNNEEYLERLELVSERLEEIAKNPEVVAPFDAYFKKAAEFVLTLKSVADQVIAESNAMSGENGKKFNQKLFFDEIGKEAYETSFFNPTYATSVLGEEYGLIFSALLTQMRQSIGEVYQGDIRGLCLRAELLVEEYVLMQEEDAIASTAKEIFSSFMHDNIELERSSIHDYRFNEQCDFAASVLLEADITNTDYLYRYGLAVGENEVKIHEFIAKMPEDEVQAMADTFTEGFRIGFEVLNKPLEKKTICDIIYPIGFERMVRLAAKNFEKLGLRTVAYPETKAVNKQYQNDHEKDMALWLDKSFVERFDEINRNVLDGYKEVAPKYAGPAVVETFGETPFEPESRKANATYDEKQQKLFAQWWGEKSQTLYEYIHGDERSFTIIAYPVPEIGEKFEEIFAETVKLNTLDYNLYQTIQQKLIDVLDTADYVHVLGKGDNKTDIKVKIYDLQNPEKETAFENCVADVNIPVGEVFTTPVLKGTEGKLHVTQVYLQGRNFLNLEMDFKDGEVVDYNCSNFDSPEEGKTYIKDYIMFNHDSLPLGEFAIGTNTTAYRMGIEYQIQDKLPILIAEKTGPHFAVGDTCYSHDEDNETFNSNGKKIVARENDYSKLRKEDPAKAYFSCHTDITIPYNELKSIIAISKDGNEIPIILDGKFVVPGTEELNIPLEGLV